MSKIYEQHDAAFRHTSAFVVCDKAGERVATIAFKHGNAVTCYLHIIGLEMTKGIANGGGYDRKSASACHAANKIVVPNDGFTISGERAKVADVVVEFQKALYEGNEGSSWDNALRNAGYKVFQAC